MLSCMNVCATNIGESCRDDALLAKCIEVLHCVVVCGCVYDGYYRITSLRSFGKRMFRIVKV